MGCAILYHFGWPDAKFVFGGNRCGSFCFVPQLFVSANPKYFSYIAWGNVAKISFCASFIAIAHPEPGLLSGRMRLGHCVPQLKRPRRRETLRSERLAGRSLRSLMRGYCLLGGSG